MASESSQFTALVDIVSMVAHKSYLTVSRSGDRNGGDSRPFQEGKVLALVYHCVFHQAVANICLSSVGLVDPALSGPLLGCCIYVVVQSDNRVLP